jgi:hypothetical protein
VRVHGGERVEFDLMPLQGLESLHDPVESRLAPLVQTVPIVQLPRPVDGDPHQKPIPGQELAPRVVQQRPVGLERIVDGLAAGVPLLQGHGLLVEGEPHERGLAALPAEADLRRILGLDVLANEELERLLAHPPCGPL